LIRPLPVILAVAFLFFGLEVSGALQLGDDVGAFYRAQAKAFVSSRVLGALQGQPGYETAVLATDSRFSHPPFLLVLRKTNGSVILPFGTVEGAADQATLLLDSDGDGRVDLRTKQNLVPGWLGLKIPGPRGKGDGFRALADRIYHQYDQTSGPVPAQLTILIQTLEARALDPSNPDRDLFAALKSALDQGVVEPSLVAGTLGALAAALKSRGGDHPLPALFRGEALGALGRIDEAQAQFRRMLVLDPGSTIAASKLAQDDPTRLAAFRKAHPDFWATRD